MYTIHAFSPGQRVVTHAATDAFMRGLRYGTVTKVGKKYVHVQMDANGKSMTVLPHNLLPSVFA